MKKLGFAILAITWIVSYYLKYLNPIISQLIVDYYITFSYCIGTSILAYCEFTKESNKWTKYMFWNVITILGGVIVLTYIVDLIIDDLIGTKKIILSALATSFISLCIYLFKQN